MALEPRHVQHFFQTYACTAIRVVQCTISAANTLLHTEYPMVTNLTAKIGNDEQQRLLDSLCRAKPEQDFSRAGMQLLDKIRAADNLQPISK